ncbi:MAG: hypothetical protein KC493_03780 [Bacteriovoracaceae bacterium]|nr:hypothetical protein [Bacteriovoracaceae bacterium]
MSYKWNFTLIEGKLHKGGHLHLSFDWRELSIDVNMQIDFEIKLKGFVPIPSKYKKGILSYEIPGRILDPDLWETLKQNKDTEVIDKIEINFLKESSKEDSYFLNYKNNMITGIIVFNKGEWDSGPKHIKLSVHNIPVINSYDLDMKRE